MIFEGFETILNIPIVFASFRCFEWSSDRDNISGLVYYYSSITQTNGENHDIAGEIYKVVAIIVLFIIAFPLLSYVFDETGMPHGTFTGRISDYVFREDCKGGKHA